MRRTISKTQKKASNPEEKAKKKNQQPPTSRDSTSYMARCKCGFERKLKYGRENNGTINEVFGCPKCKDLFTIKFSAKLECPKCKETKLQSYNPHKQENIEFYKSRHKEHQLDKEGLKQLTEFWESIREKECPRCGKKNLIWTAGKS